MTQLERMLAAQTYDALDPELLVLRRRARELTAQLEATLPGDGAREALLRRLLGSAGENLLVETGFRCDYGCHIHVGNNFFANFDCVILDCAEVHIGNNCLLAPQVGIYTATHPLSAAERRVGIEFARPITIGDDCWIGARAVINPGVTLGDGVVVASGAVVTRSFGDYVLLAGCPAKVIRHLDA